ncbi:Uncharacterised protein [Vibrio cholerae]|nr:Uncharacterised protein [Vibrio cholerae]
MSLGHNYRLPEHDKAPLNHLKVRSMYVVIASKWLLRSLRESQY